MSLEFLEPYRKTGLDTGFFRVSRVFSLVLLTLALFYGRPRSTLEAIQSAPEEFLIEVAYV